MCGACIGNVCLCPLPITIFAYAKNWSPVNFSCINARHKVCSDSTEFVTCKQIFILKRIRQKTETFPLSVGYVSDALVKTFPLPCSKRIGLQADTFPQLARYVSKCAERTGALLMLHCKNIQSILSLLRWTHRIRRFF